MWLGRALLIGMAGSSPGHDEFFSRRDRARGIVSFPSPE
jgi:hypothetical protein